MRRAVPAEIKLLIACAGIFFSFSYFAVLQEDVYKKSYGGEKFIYTFFALLIERGINALMALVGVAMLGGSGVTIPKVCIPLSCHWLACAAQPCIEPLTKQQLLLLLHSWLPRRPCGGCGGCGGGVLLHASSERQRTASSLPAWAA